MRNIEIFNHDNFELYNAFCKSNELNIDIYYSCEFLFIEAISNKCKFEIFTYKNKNGVFIYPYLVIQLNGPYADYCDITSPYGYCGPYCNNETLFAEAELAFIDYIKEKRVITEFIRYHYLYNSKQLFQQNVTNIKNRTVVLLNTSQTWDNIWSNEFSTTNRNIVRKLEKEGYEFEIISNYNEHVKQFTEMYYATMNNVSADQFYYFNSDFFINLKKKIGDKLFLARVKKEDITYCYSLFFVAGNILTYYLSARNLEYAKIPATNFMLSKAADWAHRNNLNYFNLGGGLSDDVKDPLFKFKCNFSLQKKPFYIGKRIHLEDKYNEVINNWITINGEEAYYKLKSKLQFYH